MKIELTKEELNMVLNGLYAAADGAYTMEEQMEYEVLSNKIEELTK